MIKTIFILFIVGMCTNQNWFVTGGNCSEPSSRKTNECVFECIKVFYNSEFCTSCDYGDKSTTIKLNLNQTLASLVQHNSIYYNVSTQSISTANCSNCLAGQSDTHFYERFKQPVDLIKFVKCMSNLDELTKANCTTEKNHELYANIENQLKNSTWCTEALGIKELYFKHLMQQRSINSKNDTSDESATENSTDSSVETIPTSTQPTTTVAVTLPENNEEEAKKTSVDEVTTDSQVTEHGETTTMLTIQSTTPGFVSESTTKSAKAKPTKKKKFVEDHHYMGSITIIAVIVSILLVILIVSALVLRVFVSRRKRMQRRNRSTARSNTSSTTYIFEAHQ